MINKMFPEIKECFGFGTMRLPLKDGNVDFDEVCKMVDTFISSGFNYFDTAHGYVEGRSENAVKQCLTSRYPRDKYVLADKLSTYNFEKEEEIRPLFESELKACGVDYFDFFLLHAQTETVYKKYKQTHAYDICRELKNEGKIHHLGFSFHDKAEVLETILKEQTEIEFVQLQYNYVDVEDSSVDAKRCYEVCEKYNKPVIVMEPLKGGALANLPDEAQKILLDLNNGSPASYAFRYCASQKNIYMILSGMTSDNQMKENLSFMKDCKVLTDEEHTAINKVKDLYAKQNLIQCTSCKYCLQVCPKQIRIPELIACYNAKKRYVDMWNADYYYNQILTQTTGKASDCLKCGRCEHTCPQHLPIRSILEKIKETFEK